MMKILAIETSCDETAISIVEASGGARAPRFTLLSHLVSSQVKLHAQYGGVVPNLAKREHAKNLTPLLITALKQAKLFKVAKKNSLTPAQIKKLRTTLAHEPKLFEQLLVFFAEVKPPAIDVIAVTSGPGLEPALWVGINLARALREIWQKPVVAINHLEGHLLSVLFENKMPMRLPALGLIVSGGHTELVLIRDWLKYRLLGATRDDAAGEAFDKVARLLGLGYPGGPEISKLAQAAPKNQSEISLPRPMINSGDFDFSFSGLKTAVFYLTQKLGKIDKKTKAVVADEFQQAVIDVLLKKSEGAIRRHQPKSFIITGGVAANQELRRQFGELLAEKYPEVKFFLPQNKLATDNATMIALAAYFRAGKKEFARGIKAQGTLNLK